MRRRGDQEELGKRVTDALANENSGNSERTRAAIRGRGHAAEITRKDENGKRAWSGGFAGFRSQAELGHTGHADNHLDGRRGKS